MVFNMTAADIINLYIIASGTGVCALSIMQIKKSPIREDVRKYFIAFLTLIIGYITIHFARELLEGHPGEFITHAIKAVTFMEFLMAGFMAVMLLVMILYTAMPEQKKMKVSMRAILVLLILHIIINFISMFSDMYYYFDSNNVYHRSTLYLLTNIPPMLMMVQGIYMMVHYRDQFPKHVRRAYWIYILAPLAALILQAIFSQIQFIMVATVGAAVNMFGVVVVDLLKKYEKQQMEASRIDNELSMATRIQADMLPNIFPAFPEREEFDIYASMTPAKEVGGDFYDFFLIDEDHLGIVMADVSGKGVPAALFMMASKILVQNYAVMNKDPKAALEAANEQICRGNHEEMFVTVWLGILDIATGVLTAANAGHEYPILKKPDGRFELYKDKHGFVVGGMEGVRYKDYEVQLEKGSILFLYTDGVAEATNAENELFGTDRLLDALNSAENDTPENVLERVSKAVDEFVKEAPQFDDLTMLCIRYIGKE
ncbi:MAG: PP2C family protein-serine/threonine phosphatase [Oscillospiraceae bacterium]|nr:PP2C family protein-serine/threonine phosphatase [Oscillospiraceae bacterium]